MEDNILSSRIKSIENQLQTELGNLLKVKTGKGTHAGDEGVVTDFADGVGHISGLDKARIGQKLIFPVSTERAKKLSGESELDIFGLAVDVDEDSIGCIVFGEERFIKQGDPVKKVEESLIIPVSEKMLGRVIDPFCRPLDDRSNKNEDDEWMTQIKDAKGNVIAEEVKQHILQLPIERKAPSVIDRSKINQPLQTGIKAVDSMLPIGRGQRMLVIGDRAIGKTAIGIDSIINQNLINRELNSKYPNFVPKDITKHHPDVVYCIYVAIGRKASEVRQLAEQLKLKEAMEYTTILASMANDPAPLSYIAPFSGCTLGEFFRDQGKNALIIYDDLSKHANAYRQISLLLRRPPGREAYPGDIFYLHSRLLERGSKICGKQDKDLQDLINDGLVSQDFVAVLKPFHDKGIKTYGGGSLTALPYVETKQNDYAAYVPTNIISITDGQVYLSDKLFNEGFRPAVNIGISVSRVGSKAQTKAMKQVSDGLKGYLANYREKEKYTKFGLNPSDSDIAILERGKRIIHFLKQPQFIPIPVERQIIGLFSIRKGFYDLLSDSAKTVKDFEEIIWKNINIEKVNLKQSIIGLQTKDLSSLRIDNRFFMEDLSDKLDEWQLEFIKNENLKRYRILSVLLSSKDSPFKDSLKTTTEKYYVDIDNDINNHFGGMEGRLKDSFLKFDESIPDKLRFGDFKKIGVIPAVLEIGKYLDEIKETFIFSFLIEEKQRLKREFTLKCEKQIAADSSEVESESFTKQVLPIVRIFMTEKESPESPESITRTNKIENKAREIYKDFIKKQIGDLGKLDVLLKKQANIIFEKKSDTDIKIDAINNLLGSFNNDLKDFRAKLSKINERL